MSNSQKLKMVEYKTPSKIIGIQFSILSPEEIRKNSVVEITSRDTYINNKPCIGGLFDPRMGVLEPGLICPTDGLTYIDTPGYFGHIELARPVFFIQHLKEIMKICRCFCFKCSKLLINKNQHMHVLNMTSEERWDYVCRLAEKVKRCGDSIEDGCGCRQPDKIKLEGMAAIYSIWDNINQEGGNGEKVKIRMTPELVLKIFKRISDDDVHFIGLNPKWSRPDWMICQVLPVPPPAVRPSVKHDAQQRSEDDLTHIFCNIIKTNTDLMNKIRDNAQANAIEGLTSLLQYFIAMIVNNKVKGSEPMAQRSGRPLQCIMGRLNSKNGRIRGNLMGKRVDFSARSVITGDPNLSIKQLGVPLKIAMNITKPVVVNDRNRDFLLKMIQNGPDVHPGAKILEKKNGENVSLRYVDRNSIRLENGDIVHRHMMDDDAVLFNRQPSLHRMSMMCHIVKIMKKGDTFRMNVGCTKPYNADFDGDEMNMHVPQNIAGEIELRHLAAIPWQLVSPASNSPIIGIFQDSMLGSYRFTRPSIDFNSRDAMNLLMMFNNVDVKKLLEKGEKITNFDLLSQILPPMTMKFKTKLFDEKEDPVLSNNILEIRNGEYLRGQMEKSVLGSSTKGIIHRICNDFGNMAAVKFIDDWQNIITEYMKTSSFSVGVSDLIADKRTTAEIIQVITNQKMDVMSVINEVHLGTFKNITANSNHMEFETKVNNLLNKATEQSGKIARESLSKNNRFLMIVNSGSKGSLINISQMISCLGQQNVDGKRIPYGFDNRTLPHFNKYDDSPNARGFIENSYISGLTAPELFFHAMGGRIGLIDTAVKSVTWETPIVILENGVPLYIKIGEWIDAKMLNHPDNIQHQTEKNMELLQLEEDLVYIPTTDEKGTVSWEILSAITRHDPGERLYEVKTQSGRKVIVAESKSLLIWNPDLKEFHEMNSPDVKIGDFVPVTAELSEPENIIETVQMIPYDKLENFNNKNRQFILNKRNGIFIGLFLASGMIYSDSIVIIGHNEEVSEFIRNWFNHYHVEIKTREETIDNGKIITTFRAYSNILTDFILRWIGQRDLKHIPCEAFVAPTDFICGLLTGFYSEKGVIPGIGQSIDVIDSVQIIEGISLLCSRLGIFGNISPVPNKITYIFKITSQWAKIFSEKIVLMDNFNQKRMKSIKWSLEDSIYSVQNNCILDTIIEINILGVENHPKLYDVTVPKTLNFCLANGLQVRDTSTTGYIQRRLIKGLEDLKIEYDMTVRNSKGKIVQFSYGDDGFESTKVEHQNLQLVEMSIEDIYMHYDIIGANDHDKDLLAIYNKGTITRTRKQLIEAKGRCKTYIQKMIEKRDEIVKSVFHYKNENSVKIPISFQNLIINIQGQLNLNANSIVDITPLEAFDLIDEYFEQLKQIHFNVPTPLFEIMYYFYLTPRDLLVNKRFHRKALILLLETIVLKYKQSIVHPGEMVGVIAGQSIGEPTTQLSTHSETKIIISGLHNYNGDVKTFVDNLLKENAEKVIDLGNNSVVMDLIDDYHIVGVSDTEKTSWNRILQVSRHPANGNLVKVSTKTGKTHTATLSHSFLKRIENGIAPVKGSDLKVGDRIPVAKFIPEIANPITELQIAQETVLLDKTFGKFIGSYLADGHIKSNTISISKNAIEVIEETKSMSTQFNCNYRVCSETKNSIIIPEQNIHYTREGGYTSVATSFNHPELATFIKNEFKTGSMEKLIPAWVFSSNKEFIYGILSGYFNGDGNVNDILGKEIIRCHSISERLIIDMCLLLSYAGIFAAKGVESIERKNKLHTLYICKKYAQTFKDLIGFSTEYKSIALDNVIEHNLSDDKHSEKEEYDKIPELGNVIAYIGEKLVLPGQSRNYGRWKHKTSIGRKTLESYIPIFENENTRKLSVGKYKKRIDNKYHEFTWTQKEYDEIESMIAILRQAAYSDVVWDEIIDLEIIEDNGEYVYDFTVPGNDSFMVDCGILVHNTLNTFHLSGVASKSNVTRGVPRIEELLRLTKNPKNPSLTVHLKPCDELDKEKANTFANMMEHTKLIDLVKTVEICFDPTEKATFNMEDKVLLEQFYEFENLVEDCLDPADRTKETQKSKWIVRMEFDIERLLDKNITMDDIHFAIKNSHFGNDIHCVYSDYNMDKLVFRIRTNSNIFTKAKKRNFIEPLDQSDEIYLLKNFQDSILNNIVLRGIHGIDNVIPRKLQNMVVKEDGKFSRKDVWVLDTTGSNLLDALSMDFIDSERTYCNDIKEIFDVLGIEAARQILYNEFVEVMEFADVYINYHHLSLLCDRMTATKDMVSIFRSGILNDDIGPISKSTFEVHTEVLLNAARHAEFDHMRGVSATVMLGQHGYFGTNAFGVVLDMKEMENLEATVVEKGNVEDQIEKLISFKDAEMAGDETCSKSKIEIKNNIGNIKRDNADFCDDDYNMGF